MRPNTNARMSEVRISWVSKAHALWRAIYLNSIVCLGEWGAKTLELLSAPPLYRRARETAVGSSIRRDISGIAAADRRAGAIRPLA